MNESRGHEPMPDRVRPAVQSRFRQNPRIAQQVLGGKSVLLHYEGKRLLGLNDNGTLIWSLLDGRRTLADITREVADRAGVSPDAVSNDVLEFVADLESRDLVLDDALEETAEQP